MPSSAPSPTGAVRLGLVGTGSVAQNAYLPLVTSLRAQGKVGSVAACDVRRERVEEAAKKFTLDRLATDPAEIIGAEDVDVVVVLTSMKEHGELAGAALAAGQHVLVEKPMATDLATAAALVEQARTSAGHLVCAPHVVLSPDYRAMQRKVLAGEIGRPLLARARYGWDGPDWGAWFYGPGGGPLFDLGVYNVTSLTGLLGPVRQVTAMSARTRPERIVEGRTVTVETDDTYQIVLGHEAGALSTVTTAFGMQKYRSPAIEVYGLEGTVQLLGDDWAPDGLEQWRNDIGAWQIVDSASRYWPWTDGLTHLVDCVRTGDTPATTPEHAFHVLEVMLAAMTAAETGATQPVTSTFVPPVPPPERDRGASHRIHDRVHEDAQ